MTAHAHRDLNWNYLYYFFAVMKHRSIRGAAAEVNAAASTVSEALQNLERQLDCKLLSRSTRRVEPTERGKALYNRIKPMFENRGRILASVDAEEDALPVLSVGLVANNCFASLISVLENLSAGAKAAKVVIKSCSHASLLKQLESGEVDIGMSSAPVRSKNCTSNLMFSARSGFYAHAELADLPAEELLRTCQIGLLGSDDSSVDLQNQIIRQFHEQAPRFLVCDYLSLLFEAAVGRMAIVALVSRHLDPLTRELCRVQDERLNSLLKPVDQYLIWAKRIEGSALHRHLQTLLNKMPEATV